MTRSFAATNAHYAFRLLSSSLSTPKSFLKTNLSNLPFPLTRTIPFSTETSTSRQRSSYSLRRSSSTSSASSDETQTRTMSRRSDPWSAASHRSQYGCTAYSSCSAGTKLWQYYSTHYTSPCYYSDWPLRTCPSRVVLASYSTTNYLPHCRFLIVKLNMVGPLLSITRTVGGEVQRQASSRLREHFSQPLVAAPVAAQPIKSEDEYELKPIR